MEKIVEKVRIINILTFVMLSLVRHFDSLYILSIIFSYLHVILIILLSVVEVIYLVDNKKYKTGWKSILGFIILVFTITKFYMSA